MTTWQAHIQRNDLIQLLKWSRANNSQILRQEWRKTKPAYADSYAHAERQQATQDAVLAYLLHGTIHPSPNFAIWLDYWVWWGILMTYAYNRDYMDGSFARWQAWLRIARDVMLGAEEEEIEAAPDFVPLLEAVQPLDTGIDLVAYFDMDTPEHVARKMLEGIAA